MILSKLNHLKIAHEWECLFPLLQAFALGGSRHIEISCTATQWKVTAAFESSHLRGGGCAWLGPKGWQPILWGDWQSQLFHPGPLRELSLGLWMACKSSHQEPLLQWKSGSHFERLTFSPLAPVRRKATPLLDFERDQVLVSFSRDRTVSDLEVALRMVHHRCRWSPVEVFCSPGIGQEPVPISRLQPLESDTEIDPRWGFPAGYALAERLLQDSSPPAVSLGAPGPANLTRSLNGVGEIERFLWGETSPTFFREIVGAQPDAARLEGTMLVRILLGSHEMEKLIVVRGGVVLDEIVVSLGGCGAQVFCGASDLNLDSLGLRVLLDDAVAAKVAEARRQVYEALLNAQTSLHHVVPWDDRVASRDDLINVVGTLLGAEFARPRLPPPCRDGAKLRQIRLALDDYIQGSLDLLSRAEDLLA